MEFKKYSSIENYYNKKELERTLNICPELQYSKYTIQEKIDGCNFSIYFEKVDDDIQINYAKRTDVLKDDENFYDYQNVVKKYDFNKVIEFIKEFHIKTLVLYGELYGKGILKRVYYGDEKYLAFFDIKIDGEMTSPDVFMTLIKNFQLPSVPVLAIVDNLTQALEFDININSLITNKEKNLIEGIVIKPNDMSYIEKLHKLFYIKKKNEKFGEVNKKPKKEKKPISNNIINLNNIYKDYINVNRLYSIFSKYGEIEHIEDIGKYIKYMKEDIFEDFIKDYQDEFDKLSDKDKKLVIKDNGTIFLLIKNFL